MVSSALAVAAAGVALVVLVDRHVEFRVVQEIGHHLDQLIAHVRIGEKGLEVTDDLADPRFDRPLSGLYWQISEGPDVRLRSRSLWDQVIDVDGRPDVAGPFRAKGPGEQDLIVVDRPVSLTDPATGRTRAFRLTIGEDRQEINEVVSEFALEAAAFLIALVLFLGVAGWLNASVGLRPLDGLRTMVLRVRRGRAKRLDGPFPDEVEPLVAELNGLIEAQELALQRVRARAGDLAHGLKTPLAILSSEARALRERGETAAADVIESEVTGMSRFVERELARARAAATAYGQRLDLNAVIDRIVAAMMRLPRGDEIEWRVEMPNGVKLAVNREDANEIFGNVLDNARKWATGKVDVRIEVEGDRVRVSVADDGPGVPAERRSAVLMRGIRLDETVQGSGLGLSIVDDLVTAYGGKVNLLDTPGGGLTVEIVLVRPHEDEAA